MVSRTPIWAYNDVVRLIAALAVIFVFACSQAQRSNVYRPRTSATNSSSAFDRAMKRKSDTVRQASKSRVPSIYISSVADRRHEDHRRHDGVSDFDRHDRFRRFDHLVLISADTNYALHGADISIGPSLFYDPSTDWMPGVFVADNCSAHAYVARVSLARITFESCEDHRRRKPLFAER